MRTLRARFFLVGSLFALLIAIPAHALSNRIFMSTNGNNANDCAGPLTPCLTFAGALAQVNPGGEVIAEATGGYGLLNITQAVTISGPPGVVIYSGLGVAVNAPGATVVLRGLTIDGTGAAGQGIDVASVGTLSVESCVIANFNGDGLYFRSPGNLFVKDTIVRNIGLAGILVAPSSGSAKATLDHCGIENTFNGLVAFSNAATTIRDSVVSGSAHGFFAELGGELNIENCLAANNDTGIFSSEAGSLVRVSNSTVTDNGVGLAVMDGGDIFTRSNNTVRGNVTKGSFTGSFAAD